MTYDMNDAELPRTTELIPDGTFALLTMKIRPGGVDGQGEVDRGLLKSARNGGDALMVDAEFTIAAGLHARRKFWQNFTVIGGKVDEKGVSIAWKISKGMFRAMIDSAVGLDPQDMSEAAKAKRLLRGLAELQGITFAAKVGIEPSTDPRYPESNKLDRIVLPGEPEYARIMAGESLPPAPSHRPQRAAAPVAAASSRWGGMAPSTAPTTPPAPAPRMWERPAASLPAQAAPQPTPAPAPTPMPLPAPVSGGPSWLNG